MKRSECEVKIRKILAECEDDIFTGGISSDCVVLKVISFIRSEFGLEKD